MHDVINKPGKLQVRHMSEFRYKKEQYTLTLFCYRIQYINISRMYREMELRCLRMTCVNQVSTTATASWVWVPSSPLGAAAEQVETSGDLCTHQLELGESREPMRLERSSAQERCIIKSPHSKLNCDRMMHCLPPGGCHQVMETAQSPGAQNCNCWTG